jgi:cytochrome c oxidase subunit 3
MSGGDGVLRPRGDKGEPGAGALGLALFLASLIMLFGGGLVAYWVIRSRSPVWPPPDAPDLPLGMWVSTALLLLSSVTIQQALSAVRRGQGDRLRRRLVLTLVIAAGFVASQAWNWLHFYRLDSTFYTHLYGFTFYMLTGLHALHVLGGLIALIVVSVRAYLGHYSWAYYPGVRLTTIYWHFLGAVWLILFGLLLLDG